MLQHEDIFSHWLGGTEVLCANIEAFPGFEVCLLKQILYGFYSCSKESYQPEEPSASKVQRQVSFQSYDAREKIILQDL